MARICRAVRAAGPVLSAVLAAGCASETGDRPVAVEPTSVLVADFVNSTADPIFEPALRHALALALGQSAHIRVFDGARAADSLRAMNRSADERVTADLAWEIAAREAVDVLVLGSIDRQLDDHVITLEVVAWRDGATMARETARATSRADVIDALGRTALDVRRSLGEPAQSVAQSDRPLTQLTTASLEALAHYATGREHADRGRHRLAEPHYCHALAIDPGFELARTALRTAPPGHRTQDVPEC